MSSGPPGYDRPEGSRPRHPYQLPEAAAPSGRRRALSRRSVLRMAAATGGLGLSGALSDVRLAFGATGADTLVVLTLRGGADGLSIIPPIGDPDYVRARPTIAVPAGSTRPVDRTFGLHPALAPLFPQWESGRMAAVHAVGQPVPSRSHSVALRELQRGAPGSGVATGWLERATGLIAGADVLTAGQVGNPNLPDTLTGGHPVFAVGTLDSLTVQVSDSIVPLSGWQAALDQLKTDAGARMTGPTSLALAAAAKVQQLPPAASAAEAGYPSTNLGVALHDVVRLVKANLGLRLASVDVDGWDMHAGLGGAQKGAMVDRLSELAKALAAFVKELGTDLDRVVVVTVSEFGRRVAENGSGGVDHGYGTASLLLGGAVNGGKVYGSWPTLAADRLNDGDLAASTDHRQVLAELLAKRCGITAVTTVFPGLKPAPLGLVDARPAG